MLRSQTTADLPYISETLPVLSSRRSQRRVSPLTDSSVELMAAVPGLPDVPHQRSHGASSTDPIPPDVDDPALHRFRPIRGFHQARQKLTQARGRKADSTGAPNRAGGDPDH
jgi:hypothetical protein